MTAEITPKPVLVGFTAVDKEYDGTTAAAVELLVFTDQLAPGDEDVVAVTVLQAAFAAAEPGQWLVAILDSTITGNDDGNYEFSFADDVKADILYNTQVVPSGWNMLVMTLDSLTAESAAAWSGLGLMAVKNTTMQIQRNVQPHFGESFWVFNRGNEAVVLQGLKRVNPPAWVPPAADNAWILAGPPAEDFVVPPGVLVWTWDGRVFVLIPAGGVLPAGRAAWLWQ